APAAESWTSTKHAPWRRASGCAGQQGYTADSTTAVRIPTTAKEDSVGGTEKSLPCGSAASESRFHSSRLFADSERPEFRVRPILHTGGRRRSESGFVCWSRLGHA